jgi:hypothetical protein
MVGPIIGTIITVAMKSGIDGMRLDWNRLGGRRVRRGARKGGGFLLLNGASTLHQEADENLGVAINGGYD